VTDECERRTDIPIAINISLHGVAAKILLEVVWRLSCYSTGAVVLVAALNDDDGGGGLWRGHW